MFESDLGREITNYVLVMLFSFQHCNKRFAFLEHDTKYTCTLKYFSKLICREMKC